MVEQIPFPTTLRDIQEILREFELELEAAERKFPGWPTDVVHGTSIVVEEAGESMRAALQQYYEPSRGGDLRKELVQTGAMALRMLLYLRYLERR